MKKRNLLLMVMVAMALVFVAGCSSAPKEDEIKDDLISCGDDQLLRDGETLDSIEITDRTTDNFPDVLRPCLRSLLQSVLPEYSSELPY